MLASKTIPGGLSEGSNLHKQPSNRRATSAPRVSRLANKPAIKPADRAPSSSPLHHHAALDRSSASIDLPQKPSPPGGSAVERRSLKAASTAASRGSTTTTNNKQQPTATASAKTTPSSELQLQAQLTLVQDDLRTARDRLASIENDRAQILDDLAADAEEALELERFKSTEREQSVIDLAQRKYDNIRQRHAEDVTSLIATARELDAVREELAATARAKDTAAETIETMESEASTLRAELRNAKETLANSFEEKQAQLHRVHQEKVAALEKEASEYKERFLDTSRLLEVAAEEATGLHATIDGLKSEHQLLLQEARRQAVGQVTEEKNRLVRELADTREERDQAKKAVEDLSAALREVSAEAKERVLAKQAEVDGVRVQMSEELKAAMENAEERHRLRMEELSYENECLRKTVERMGSEAKVAKDDWVSKEARLVDMLKRSEDGVASIQMEMNRLMESLRAAENEVQVLRADKTRLLGKLQEFETQATSTKDEAKEEISHLKDVLSSKDQELLALNHELAELRLREMAARNSEEESTDYKSKALQAAKLEMDSVLESLKAEANAAKEEKVQLQNKLRLLEITETSLSSEEAKISSLRLKETLEDKEHELARIVQENREMRAREAAAHAKIDELALLLAEASTARKGGGGEVSNGAVTRSPEKQHSVLLKLICPTMHHNVQDDENNGEMIQNQKEDIKHVEVETVRPVKHEKERSVSPSAMDANSLENSKIIEDDLSKERDDDDDSESSDDEDDVESTPGDDALVDQMNGLLIHGPTSSFNRDQQHVQKKKRALLKKFGSLLKKKTHFTKLNSHSHS